MNRYLNLVLSASFLTSSAVGDETQNVKSLYLDLLQKCIIGNAFEADTMISHARLNALWKCMVEVEQNHVPGDFIETGVWRGGATIFMKAFLASHENRERKLWVADSFAGFPESSRSDGAQLNNRSFPHLVVSLDTVKANFSKYGLLDDQVHFIKGFFSETLSKASIEKLAILRLDGDLYDSTMDALTALYPKLSIGGYVIVDDFGYWPGCAEAVRDYRKLHQIDEPIVWEDDTGVHWQKTH